MGGGSCDYAHVERAGGGAYIMEKDSKVVERYDIADLHTTEFRMMLTVMLHAMTTIPDGSSIVFLTNVSYIQNFDKEPTDSSANADLIRECIAAKKKTQFSGGTDSPLPQISPVARYARDGA